MYGLFFIMIIILFRISAWIHKEQCADSEGVTVFHFSLSISISESTKGADQCKELSTEEADPKGMPQVSYPTDNLTHKFLDRILIPLIGRLGESRNHVQTD